MRNDELFAKGVQLLNKNNDINTRRAGIYVLKDLALQSYEHTQKCIDMLCAVNETWMPGFLTAYPNFFTMNMSFTTRVEEKLDPKKIEIVRDSFPLIKEYNIETEIILSKLALQSLGEIFKELSNPDKNISISLQNKYLCGIYLFNINLSFVRNLENADFTAASISKSEFKDCYAVGAKFHKAYLEGIVFHKTELASANFDNSLIDYIKFYNSNFSTTSFTSAELNDCSFIDSDLYGAKFNHTEFINTTFINSSIYGAYFNSNDVKKRKTSYERTDFQKAEDVESAHFDNKINGAIFNDEDLEKLKKQGHVIT